MQTRETVMRGAAILSATLMLLAACDGGGGSGNASTAAAPDGEAAANADAHPMPGTLKTFGDWAVGCDNLGLCKAAALGPEGGDFPAVLMSISRAGRPDGTITVAFLSTEAIELPLRVAVDGRPVGEGGRTDDDATRIEGDLARRIAAAAANGRVLTVADGGNAATSSISLAGLAAALRYMDDRQGRAGTRGALVARGAAPDTRAAPAAPVVVALAPSGTAAAPSPQQLAQFRSAGGCDEDMARNSAQPFETHAIGGGTTLLLLPCSAGAYNVTALVYVGDAAGFKPMRSAIRLAFLYYSFTLAIFLTSGFFRDHLHIDLLIGLPMMIGDALISAVLFFLLRWVSELTALLRWTAVAIGVIAVALVQAAWDTQLRIWAGADIIPHLAYVRSATLNVYHAGMFAALLAFQASNLKLREQQRLLDTSRKSERDAHMLALRFQLNPHFMFNTLNAISSLVIVGRAREANA